MVVEWIGERIRQPVELPGAQRERRGRLPPFARLELVPEVIEADREGRDDAIERVRVRVSGRFEVEAGEDAQRGSDMLQATPFTC